jgi:hypothetical protein
MPEPLHARRAAAPSASSVPSAPFLIWQSAGSDVQFARKGGQPQDSVVSVVVGGQSLSIIDIDAPSGNLEATDVKCNCSKYGNLVSYAWFGDGQVAIGYDSGYFVVMNSVHDGAEEASALKLHTAKLSAVAVSPVLRRAATCSSNVIKVISLEDEVRELPDEMIALDAEVGTLEQVAWGSEGQVLMASSSTGCVYNFLASLPVLACAHGSSYMCDPRKLPNPSTASEPEHCFRTRALLLLACLLLAERRARMAGTSRRCSSCRSAPPSRARREHSIA